MMKRLASGILGAAMGASAAMGEGVATNSWIRGKDADALASNPANWSLRHAPSSNEVVRLSQGHPRAIVWDEAAPRVVAGWIQEEGYAAIATIRTTPREDGFSALEILGDMHVLGGALTHPANDDAESWWLSLRVGGAFVVGRGAFVSASAKGFGSGRGPSPAVMTGGGASHGGQGAPQALAAPDRPARTYGSILSPLSSGSGGTAREGSGHAIRGGGVIVVEAGGDVTIEGCVAANADSRDPDGANIGGAAGGSVNIRAGGKIQGDGTITANGGRGYHDGAGGGGGGRIALVSGASLQMDVKRVTAHGGCGESAEPGTASRDRHIRGAAGTIYLVNTSQEAKGGGRVIVKDWHRPTLASTRIPADLNAPADECRDVKLAIEENGFVTLTASTTIRELAFTSGGLDLNGSTLVVGAIVKGWGDTAKFDTPGTYTTAESTQMDSVIFNKGGIVVRTYFKPLF